MYAYLWEAKKLQRYIFATGKLRDASGASELLNDIAFETEGDTPPSDLLARALGAAELRGEVTVTRRASGAVAIVFDGIEVGKIHRFRALWRMAVVGHVPGLPFVDGLGAGDDVRTALDNARKALEAVPPVPGLEMPLAAPLVRLAPRTGLPPVPTRNTGEYVDAATHAQREFDRHRGRDLLGSIVAGDRADAVVWPKALSDDGDLPQGTEVLPYDTDRHRIAVIHADGNGMGRLFIDAAKASSGPQEMRDLSRALESATRKAVQTATEAVLLPAMEKGVVPARPILLGGDDLTIIVRSDLALRFTRLYLREFERRTKELHGRFDKIAPALKDGLKAKAGIVFIGARQPFVRAYDLCETLATKAGRDPADASRSAGKSRIAFWRVVSSQFESDVPEILKKMRAGEVSLWRESWPLDGLEALDDLVAVIGAEDVGRGPMRRVPDLLLSGDRDEANRAFRRALDMVEERNRQTHGDLLRVLGRFGINPAVGPVGQDGYCPLLDAHALAQMQ